MKELTRREFGRLAAVLGTTVFFSACGAAGNAAAAPAGSIETLVVRPGSSSEGSSDHLEEQTSPTAGKTLVVFYSSTGNTKAVAEYIANAAGADLFELKAVNAYTPDDLYWPNPESRVSYEHDHPEARVVELEQVTPERWDEYDTVFVGYPIWWGIAAWPLDGFVQGNDFTGKTVIPFCTSASSGFGESGMLLAEQAGTGAWQEGRRFRSGVSAPEVTGWVGELDP